MILSLWGSGNCVILKEGKTECVRGEKIYLYKNIYKNFSYVKVLFLFFFLGKKFSGKIHALLIIIRMTNLSGHQYYYGKHH